MNSRPVRLVIYVGAGMGDGWTAELDGDELRWTHDSDAGAADHRWLIPNARAWRSFRRSVEGAGATDWSGTYELPVELMITDGTNWALDIEWPDGTVVGCDGYEAYPPRSEPWQPTRQFNTVCRAVSRLAGGLPFAGQTAKVSRPAPSPWPPLDKLLHMDPKTIQGALGNSVEAMFLAGAIADYRAIRSPFDGVMEAPMAVHESHVRHAEPISAAADELRAAVRPVLEELHAALLPPK